MAQTIKERRTRKSEQAKQAYKENPDMRAKIKAQAKAWWKANPMKQALKGKAKRANKKAKEFGCKRKLKMSDIQALLIDPFECYYCSKPLSLEQGKRGEHKIWEIDHKTPFSRGGSNTPDNIVACDYACNNRKGSLTAEEFFASLRTNLK